MTYVDNGPVLAGRFAFWVSIWVTRPRAGGANMQSKEKFIAFLDILGFSALVEQAEASGDLSRPIELAQLLGDGQGASEMVVIGPKTCPQSAYIEKGLDFQITQISDCAVISAEVSPAGLINLVHHCFGLSVKLLSKHAQCRGMITRGNIYHQKGQFIGTGYQAAYRAEAGVAFLRADEAERGTPFIQIDPSVISYVQEQTDDCVRKMFERLTLSDGTFTAIYPFKALAKIPSALVHPGFNPLEMKQAVQRSLRFRRENLDELLTEEERAPDDRAKVKIRHYIQGLEDVIARLRAKEAELDEMLATRRLPPIGSVWGA